MRNVFLAAVVLITCLSAVVIEAKETRLVVRAKSRDAKFVGTSMGGALVVISDSETGDILAKGLTEGATGSTQKIMIDPLRRGATLTDNDTAKFETVLDIREPRLITIEVQAPYLRKEAMIKSSTQVWIIPGKHIVGDGLVVEIPGFFVDILKPADRAEIRLSGKTVEIPIQANIAMI